LNLITTTSFRLTMAPSIKVGDTVPQGTFKCVPYTPELSDVAACGIPVDLKIDEWKGKKVVLFAVPGAFTPTCHKNHFPGFVQNHDQFKAKGVDVVAVLATNDPFVMSGWMRFNGVKDQIIALTDPDAQWSKGLGLSMDLTARGMGIRTARFAMVLDDLKVTYLGVEEAAGVDVSGADAVLAML